MSPFDGYPGQGRALLGTPRDIANCRHGYGLELQQVTGQTTCAYCGVSLVNDYYSWLLLSVDHVLPRGQGSLLKIPPSFVEDLINLVLCCAGCNGFGNRYVIPNTLATPLAEWTLDAFLALRDQVFADRLRLITERREKEQEFYATRPWTRPPSPRKPFIGAVNG